MRSDANRNRITLIGIVSKKNSILYKASDIKIYIPEVKESGHGIVPTSSTTTQLAIGDALSIARSVAAMAAFGIEARHLRSFKSSADREIGLVEQVITPLTRQKNTESKARAEEVQKEIASLSIRLHASLVRGGLNRLR